jgi:ferritin
VKITQKMLALLQRQIEHEFSNMYKYQKISMILNVQGFEKISNYFKEWANEEKSHALWVQEFLEDINQYVDFNIMSTTSISGDSSIISIAELVLETELMTNDMLDECLDEACSEGNSKIIMTFIQNKMLQEQIEETNKAYTFLDHAKNIMNANKSALQLFNSEFE